MYGITIISVAIFSLAIAALPTNLAVQGISPKVLLDAANVIDTEALIPRSGISNVGTTVNNGMKHSPQLQPVYIAIVVVACIITAVSVVAAMFRCVMCWLIKRESQVEPQSSEETIGEEIAINPLISVPQAAVTKGENPVEDFQSETRPVSAGSQVNRQGSRLS
ncbi:hypothetical protein F4810DRAFT_707959 [Camillea tinctor]|nr:hypothetical protein F4810DRAFT_707959 [Camillea tinctor]